MLTKNDLKQILNLLNVSLKPLKDDIEVIKSHNLRIEMEMIDLKETFEHNLKQWKSDLFTKIDSVLGRLTTAELENTANKAQQPLVKRIKKIENHLGLPTPTSS